MLEEISGRTLSDCIRRQGSDMLSISNARCANSISIKGNIIINIGAIIVCIGLIYNLIGY